MKKIILTLFISLLSLNSRWLYADIVFSSKDPLIKSKIANYNQLVNLILKDSQFITQNSLDIEINQKDFNSKLPLQDLLLAKVLKTIFKKDQLNNDPAFLMSFGWSVQYNSQSQQWYADDYKYIYRNKIKSKEIIPEEIFVNHALSFFNDNDYKCKLPTISRYLVKKFQMSEFNFLSKCSSIASYIEFNPLTFKNEIKNLDLSRLHSIQYLLVSPSKNVASKFGHSLLKFVFCASYRTEVSDKCLEDFSSHVVVSFRAATGLDKISTVKGLTGKYPMRMYFMDLESVRAEYNIDEYRDLETYPLKINRNQAIGIALRAIETHWQYSGKYYFTSQNCATETLSLLKSGTQNDQFMELLSSTPIGIKKDLLEKRLTNPVDQKNNLYYLKSYKEIFSKAENTLINSKGINYQSFENFSKSTNEDKLAILELLKSKSEIAAFQILFEKQYLQKSSDLLSLAFQYQRDHGKKEIWDLLIETDKNNSGAISSGEKYQANFGIPERKEIEMITKLLMKNEKAVLKIEDLEENKFLIELKDLEIEKQEIQVELHKKYLLLSTN